MARDKDLVSSQAGLAAAVAVESGPGLGEGTEPVRARSYWEQVWIRFRRDKIAIASGVFIIFLVLTAIFGGPLAAHLLGHGPNDIFFSGVNDDLLPVGPWTHVATPDGGTTLFILGADGTLGRDEFLRLLYGARVSLEVAVLSRFVSATDQREAQLAVRTRQWKRHGGCEKRGRPAILGRVDPRRIKSPVHRETT